MLPEMVPTQPMNTADTAKLKLFKTAAEEEVSSRDAVGPAFSRWLKTVEKGEQNRYALLGNDEKAEFRQDQAAIQWTQLSAKCLL